MANLDHFTLNTTFTALSQLSGTYSASLKIGATSVPPLTFSTLLGSATINVPAGSYNDVAIIYYSRDGQYKLTHSFTEIWPSTSHRVVVGVSRYSATQYRMTAFASNPSSSAQTIPAFTATAWLKLLASPFEEA